MAIVFFDTSALVKRYVTTEAGAPMVRDIVEAADVVPAIARVSMVEMASALGRRQRQGQLSAAERDRLWAEFEIDLETTFAVVEPDDDIWKAAQILCFRHPLAAYDAVQLATALRSVILASSPLGEQLRFCTADRQQATAAKSEGLTVEWIA